MAFKNLTLGKEKRMKKGAYTLKKLNIMNLFGRGKRGRIATKPGATSQGKRKKSSRGEEMMH